MDVHERAARGARRDLRRPHGARRWCVRRERRAAETLVGGCGESGAWRRLGRRRLVNKPAVRAPAARPAAAASTRDGWALCRRRRRRRREQAAGRSRRAPAARLAGRRRALRPRARCSYRYLSAPLMIEFGAAAEACGVVLRCWVLSLVPSCVLVSVGIAAAPVVVVSTAPRVGVRAHRALRRPPPSVLPCERLFWWWRRQFLLSARTVSDAP